MTTLIVRHFKEKQEYIPTWQRMQQFTATRNEKTGDEIWLLEHQPVYTQGLAGKAEHVLCAGDTPVVQTDRGGQVTWHGPGQLMFYTLLDVRRLKWGARTLVSALENLLIDWLAEKNITAFSQRSAPGVYVRDAEGATAKIAALGLRITQKGCYHGMAVNITNALESFDGINPCGAAGQRVARLDQFLMPLPTQQTIKEALAARFASVLRCERIEWHHG